MATFWNTARVVDVSNGTNFLPCRSSPCGTGKCAEWIACGSCVAPPPPRWVCWCCARRWPHPEGGQLSQPSGHVAHSDFGAVGGKGWGDREQGWGEQRRPHRARERWQMWKGYRGRAKRKKGEPVNWTPAHISCPLDWVSGAIKTTDMHTEGGGLGEVMAEQEAGALSSAWMWGWWWWDTEREEGKRRR